MPRDQHAACVDLMRARIARAGTIEGVVFDLKTQAVTCVSVGALSFLIAASTTQPTPAWLH